MHVHSALAAFAGALLMPGWHLSAQKPAPAPRARLYLLAATPHSNDEYPVTLYRVTADRKLRRVRVVESGVQSAVAVIPSRDSIFIAHPGPVPTIVTTIHFSDPLREDDVAVNPAGDALDEEMFAAAELPRSTELLLPFMKIPSDTENPRGKVVETLTGVLTSPDSASRLVANPWADYSYLWYDEDPGGPNVWSSLIGKVIGDHFYLQRFGQEAMIAPASRELEDADSGDGIGIEAANDQYVVAFHVTNQADYDARREPAPEPLWVYSRSTRTWKRILVEGSSPRVRLAGSWLEVEVRDDNWDHRVSPGREKERSTGTDSLPSVQSRYASIMPNSYCPGILILQNLKDGRKIRINTGQEDSEILYADATIVLYRVNDAIYEANIEADKLGTPALVVQDDDVAEIHWVFWSGRQ